jgi:iron-sulfur cluster assembly accessory protein
MTIKLTEAAAAEAKKAMEDSDALLSDKMYLRIEVKGGGCSGFEYNLTVSLEYDEQKDKLSHQHGVDVIVDRKSDLYLDGTTLDYYTDISKRGFVFDNPNAVKSCGCGSSFSV